MSEKNFKINIYCEKCKKAIMLPVEMPQTKNELIKYVKDKFDYSKPFILTEKQFDKLIRSSYIRFKCPKCNWEKITKLQQILIEGFIDASVCKNCELDVCLWINCKKGGYLK